MFSQRWFWDKNDLCYKMQEGRHLLITMTLITSAVAEDLLFQIRRPEFPPPILDFVPGCKGNLKHQFGMLAATLRKRVKLFRLSPVTNSSKRPDKELIEPKETTAL